MRGGFEAGQQTRKGFSQVVAAQPHGVDGEAHLDRVVVGADQHSPALPRTDQARETMQAPDRNFRVLNAAEQIRYFFCLHRQWLQIGKRLLQPFDGFLRTRGQRRARFGALVGRPARIGCQVRALLQKAGVDKQDVEIVAMLHALPADQELL